MIPELGHISLIIAFVLAIGLTVIPFWGSFRTNVAAMNLAPSLAVGILVFTATAFGLLATSFLQDDFSVAVVAANSNSLLPPIFKFSALWGNHEGSLLLWVLILSTWMTAVAFLSRGLPLTMIARVLSVMGLIAVGFLAFSLLTSNPFERLLPNTPLDGSDLNPLLQDPGLIIHPPLLYMGYVGLAVPFAFAVAALLGGRLDASWARWSRPWTNVAWAFLTLGIMLGSWWAYYELGWGGWWFWDPVENASLMPWLAGTALMHSVSATEKRGVFRSWTLLLAIFAFSLSLLGTFLVRSGILTSVHAFAADPERGVFMLMFLAVVIGGSLMLFALRGPAMQKVASYSGWSREAMLLINNVLLVSSLTMILVGTLYPLIADVLELGKISVGPPYFNFFFVPLSVGLVVAMGIAVFSKWKATDSKFLLSKIPLPLAIAVVGAIVLPFVLGDTDSGYSVIAGLTLLLSLWLLATIVIDLKAKIGTDLTRLAKLSHSYLGMQLAHSGLAILVLGVGLNAAYDEIRELRMAPGDSAMISGYQFDFKGVNPVAGPNFTAYRGQITVTKGGKWVANLFPEKRQYNAGGQVMTEAAIDPSLMRDIYVSLGEPLAEGSWAVSLQVKAFVRCIWLGGILVGLGGLIAATDRRYRRRKKLPENKRAEA